MAKQNSLGLKVEQELNSVEGYQFDPIKGYPMLHWKGKRPFIGTQYYPAQLKENHGEDTNGWMNKIFWGDNLQVMSHLLKTLRGQIDLIYIDPPYDSKADYKKKILVKNKTAINDTSAFEEKQYTDLWSNDEYLQFIYERLILIRELLSSRGTIYLHCDWHKVHHLRCIMDEVFGPDKFLNEIIWQKIRVAKSQSKSFGNVHDTILVYGKGQDAVYNRQYVAQDAEYINKFDKTDKETGKRYQLVSMLQAGQGEPRKFGEKLLYPGADKHWIWSQERIDDAMEKGLIEFTKNGLPRKKQFYDEGKGKDITDIWTDIFPVNSQALEDTQYPTQKPRALIERIIHTSSNEGDLVFDCFMGSGTTQEVAMNLGRRFIGADINLTSIQITTKRLLAVAKILKGTIQETTKYTGFSVYNVNHYDVFRNPVQAKDILIKALEIQPLPNNNLYDGEKDGRMVKIMPINRIATRADLNELITNFDYRSFEKTNEKNPGRPVESLMLICMGHEADLAAQLQSAVPYKLDVEVVDILRDNAELEFKRDSEIEVVIEGGKLIVREFYPMNLLQKLSLMKENIEDWKELTDSIMIDFNYDGGVFEPQIVDVSEGNVLVVGIYDIPKDAGTIRIKITDVLSESMEQTISA